MGMNPMLFQFLSDSTLAYRKLPRKDGGARLEIDVPGTKRGEARVFVESGTLDLEIEGRNRGHWTWSLDPGIDPEAIEARLEDGVLTLELPLKAGEGRKAVEVK